MSLPQPTAVAAAVSGGSPTDVREWVAVDIVGPPSEHRRGYAIFTEPLGDDGHSAELARQVRDVLLHELRLHAQQAPDAALAHAFGVANSLVVDDARLNGGDPKQIGATAMVLERHSATIAHVPPGQLVLVQDNLVYGVPALDSRSPHWAEPPSLTPNPEPLGYSNRIAPLLVQTELLPGDTFILCNDATARILAEQGLSSLNSGESLRQYHGVNPDLVLDSVRNMAVDAGEPFVAVAVITFPPDPTTTEIETLSDVARNAREQVRHARAAVRSVVPTLPSVSIRRQSDKDESADGEESSEPEEVAEPEFVAPKPSFQERLIRLTEGRATDAEATWKPRKAESLYGAPGVHGVRKHKRISGGPSLRAGMPRAPLLNSRLFVGLMLLAVFLVGMLVWSQRDIFMPDEDQYASTLAAVDQHLDAADALKDDNQIRTELTAAQEDLERAEELGAPGDEIDSRQERLTAARDRVDGVLRVTGVRRIGSLPDMMANGNTSAYMTSGGIFLANGNLYRLNPETAEMQMMLQTGREIEDIRVGDLFGVAYDGSFLVTTDGRAVFFASGTDGALWQAMEMEEINNQGPWQPGPIGAYNESLYLLEPDFRNIYVFPTDANSQVVAPVDWVSVGDRVNLNIAVDMAIDSNIYVLLKDGQVITLRSGLEVHRYELPEFDYENQEAVAIVTGESTGYIYVLVEDNDGSNGRVIATDTEGENAVILELPEGFGSGGANVLPPFEDVQDIVIDEDTGTFYIVNGDAVWSFQYSLPALEDPNATPEAATPEPE